jgi:transposase-like protein
VKVAGRWRYVYRAIDQFGQVVDVFVSPRRDLRAAGRFFQRAIGTIQTIPSEVVTDQAPTSPTVLEESLPAAWHDTEQDANNRIEADHGRLKARLRPRRGLKQDHSARIVIAGHALLPNVRRGHYELAVEEPVTRAGGGRILGAGLGDLTPDHVAASACHQPSRCNTAPSRNEERKSPPGAPPGGLVGAGC